MSSPISSSRTPPASSNAGSVMPKTRKMASPANANPPSTISVVSAPLRAMRFRRAESDPSVIARKVGSAANGSTRKKMELSASSEKRTYTECSKP
jgi:hypothetical protein